MKREGEREKERDREREGKEEISEVETGKKLKGVTMIETKKVRVSLQLKQQTFVHIASSIGCQYVTHYDLDKATPCAARLQGMATHENNEGYSTRMPEEQR